MDNLYDLVENYDNIKLEIYEAYDNGEISCDEKEYLLERAASSFNSEYDCITEWASLDFGSNNDIDTFVGKSGGLEKRSDNKYYLKNEEKTKDYIKELLLQDARKFIRYIWDNKDEKPGTIISSLNNSDFPTTYKDKTSKILELCRSKKQFDKDILTKGTDLLVNDNDLNGLLRVLYNKLPDTKIFKNAVARDKNANAEQVKANNRALKVKETEKKQNENTPGLSKMMSTGAKNLLNKIDKKGGQVVDNLVNGKNNKRKAELKSNR